MKLIHVTRATAASLLLTAALAGCGGGGGSEDDEPAEATTVAPMSGRPGTFGEIADVKGRTAQVQNEMTGQVAVSWTDDTTFTEEVDASFGDVTVGTCVVVTDATVRITEECDQPSDLPSDLPSDVPDRVMATVGEVTAVSAAGFTVRGFDDEEVDVDVTDDTTFTTTADATADAVEVGRCLSAQGETDSTGAVAAATISVSDPVDGACGGGFAMRGPRP